MFTNKTKILAALFGACISGTILSAIQDAKCNSYTDSESEYLRSEEERDPNFKKKITIRKLCEITDEDIAETNAMLENLEL